jgi:hypothetical protein
MDTNNEWLSRRWRFVVKRLDVIARGFSGFCREAAIEYNRFRLRPISPFSYVGQVAVKATDFKGFRFWWRTLQFAFKGRRNRYASAIRARGNTPLLRHSITPFAKIRGRGRVRSR